MPAEVVESVKCPLCRGSGAIPIKPMPDSELRRWWGRAVVKITALAAKHLKGFIPEVRVVKDDRPPSPEEIYKGQPFRKQ